MDDDDIQDFDDAMWAQLELEQRAQREKELLARAPAKHAELNRITEETNAIVTRLNWALDRIYHERD